MLSFAYRHQSDHIKCYILCISIYVSESGTTDQTTTVGITNGPNYFDRFKITVATEKA